MIYQHQTGIFNDLINGRQAVAESMLYQLVRCWLGNPAFQRKKLKSEDRRKSIKYLLVENIDGVEMKEVVDSMDQTHFIRVGQEIHGHDGVYERTAHPLVVPWHYSTATQGDHGSPQEVGHSCHAVVGKVLKNDHIESDRRRQKLSDER